MHNETLADIFAATAARIPQKIALRFANETLTYAELDARANAIATALQARGAVAGRIIGLWLPRGIDLLVAQLGIAKAGCAWLPFDADTPPDRIGVCLTDADALGLVTSDACAAIFSQTVDARPCFVFEAQLSASNAPPRDVQPHHPAYVIYTSGSTGKPKGIVVNQASICHFLRSENAVLGVRETDLVYQGFSAAFDMSFEEIWISYLVGASLWIAPKEVVADPDALVAAIERERITVLHAVPTLLALFPRDVATLRIINLGGEACPDTLVDRFAASATSASSATPAATHPQRKLFNTYGPTEATVSASLAELTRGTPVTIGTPLPNYAMLVLGVDDANRDQVLATDEVGELCITGPGVAVGYLGRPELTAQKFIANPIAANAHDPATHARLYRTGDLARIDANGQVHCLGRADDQIKIRGFRVELGEIEAALVEQPGVGTAAVLLKNIGGVDQLIAYVVAEGDANTNAWKSALKSRLPPYMVPGIITCLDEMPRLLSGKIDRKALKARELAVPVADGESDTPANPTEHALFQALHVLMPGQTLRLSSDFFTDLGGHSLLAARLVSTLRTHPQYATVTVGKIYTARTVGAIAEVLTQLKSTEPATPHAPPTTASAVRRFWCGLAQAACVPPLVCLRMALWLAPFFTYHLLTADDADSTIIAFATALAVHLGVLIATFPIAIIGKWLLLGRLQPGRYPLYGFTFFRWWLVDRLSEIPPRHLLSGSPLHVWYWRLMGAKVGRDVMMGALSLRAPDLVTIGDGASIGTSVNLENIRVEGDQLIVGAIEIGRDGYVGSYCAIEGDTRIDDDARLDSLSALARGERIPAGEVWLGSPARRIGENDTGRMPPRVAVGALTHVFEHVAHFLGAALISALFFMPVFPAFMLIDWADTAYIGISLANSSAVQVFFLYLLISIPASAVLVLLTTLLSAAIRWTFLPRLMPGQWSVHSAMYLRRWITNQIQESSLQVLHGLYATVYSPWWYRLLGAKVGKGAEISTALGLVPDMLTLGDETFIADAVMLGDEEIDRGWMRLSATEVQARSFVGNGAWVPDGTVIPPNVLIGVQSRCPGNAQMKSGETWMGSPAISLPAREVLSGFSEELTFRPGLVRRLARAVIEGLRIVMPMSFIIAVGYLTVEFVYPLVDKGEWEAGIIALTLCGLAYAMASLLLVIIVKWLVIGRYRPHAAPMWTPFVWTSEAVTNIYESVAVPNFINFLRGTPMLPWALRLLGVKIGKGVYMDTTDITEFDCVTIGDHAVMNAWCGPQTHLFEDRVMKIGRVEIGAHANLGTRCTVLYGATVGDGVRLGPLTLVMKGETLPANSAWAGSPAEPQRSQA